MKYLTKTYYSDSYAGCFFGSLHSSGSGTYNKEFDTLPEAIEQAKKTARYTREDVEIWTQTHVIKFPEPDYEVVALSEE